MLTNVDIKAAVANHTLVIKGYDSNMVQPASYDMRIGTIFRDGKIINQTHPLAGDPIMIAPGEVVTMLTLEELDLPSDMAGTAYAMNDRSSEGLLVLNPGHVDPGFKGPLTVVALNLRSVPLALQLEATIFTVVFEKLPTASNPPYASRNWGRRDFERETNRKVVEKSVGSLRKLLAITVSDIHKQISEHWMSKVVTGTTIIAMIAAILACVFAITGPSEFFKREHPKSVDQPAKIEDQSVASVSASDIGRASAAQNAKSVASKSREKECKKPNC